ncbi:hypothetical protein [Actinospica robiniae]|uniref:hypothetical protein n=1 Tax=Actinospica robiniae TaxID=304901 RepID=UPI0012F85129|nr:hypothetical protein [Actinospica robiniae]
MRRLDAATSNLSPGERRSCGAVLSTQLDRAACLAERMRGVLLAQQLNGRSDLHCFTGSGSVGDCLASYKLHVDYTYQPPGDFWALQWCETGIYLALAALVSGACFWRPARAHRRLALVSHA